MTTEQTNPVVDGWVDYKAGDYEKKFYDIKLHHGVIFLGCWPNAGMFNAGGYGYLDQSTVAQVRPSKLNDIGMPERMGIDDDEQSDSPHELLMLYGRICSEEGYLSAKAVVMRMDIAALYMERERELQQTLLNDLNQELFYSTTQPDGQFIKDTIMAKLEALDKQRWCQLVQPKGDSDAK